jgi:hypothetical protein
MNRNSKNIIPQPENILRAIAVVIINIEDGNLPERLR